MEARALSNGLACTSSRPASVMLIGRSCRTIGASRKVHALPTAPSRTVPALSSKSEDKQQAVEQQKQEELPIFSFESSIEEEHDDGQPSPTRTLLAWSPLLGITLLIGAGYVFKDSIRHFLNFFIETVDNYGPAGYVAYAVVYTALEVLCVPAVPLTMTAGVIFGPIAGTAMVSASGTLAATIAFLIARYSARDKVLSFASRNPKWAAIDRAIGRDGLKFVTLLRLSPLLPLAASNYLYGLTSVELGPYVLGSWVGMLPGTYAYVTAGHLGKSVLLEGEGSLGIESWQIALGVGVTLAVLGFVGQLAKKAIEEVDADQEKSMEDGTDF